MSPAVRAAGLIAPVRGGARFVGVRARLSGDHAKAYGKPLRFRLRAVSNALVPSEFQRDSGIVILRGSSTPVWQVDAPARQSSGT